MGTIVVGVDGSQASTEALRFALAEAHLHGADVKVVNAWHIPPIVYEAGWAPAQIDLSVYPKEAQKIVETCLEQAGVGSFTVKVTTVAREGHAAKVICEEAEGADLLVVGSRGIGGLHRLMLGSVSQQCAHHAPCPIVIIPAAQHEVSTAA